MTEKDFWKFLKGLLEKGRVNQLSGTMDSDEPQLKEVGRFIGGHAFLPKDYDKITRGKIIGIGELLLSRGAAIPTKEVILIILAHHPSRYALKILQEYNQQPDKKLEIFSQIALDECRMWNG